MGFVENYFTALEKEEIVKAIQKAELNTSGEIRVHLEKTCSGDPYQRAIQIFKSLNMHKTELHNGVLFYLSLNDRKVAIIGDKGIHEKVPANFWDSTLETMIIQFKNRLLVEGLKQGITKAGHELKNYFPLQHNDTNELSNEISFHE